MFEIKNGFRLIAQNDVIPFVDLMERWPYEPAVKIAYEYYLGNLKLHYISECFTDEENHYVVFHDFVQPELSQSHSCQNLSRLAYLKEDVENIEKSKPRYRYVNTANSGYESYFDTYSLQKASHLAAEILNVLQILYWQYIPPIQESTGKPFPSKGTITSWMEKSRIYNPEHCLCEPKEKWRVSPDQMIPIFRKTPLVIAHKEKQTVDFGSIKRLVMEKRSQGIHDDVELALVVLQANPEINNGALASLVFNLTPKNKKEYEAARQRGLRLKKKVIKSHA